MALITTVYSLWIRRVASLVSTAAALPKVKQIVAKPEIAGRVGDWTLTTC